MKAIAPYLLLLPLALPALKSACSESSFAFWHSPTACFDDINCPPGSHCLNGSCVFQGVCHSDLDCGPGRRCVGGTCH